MPVTYEKENEIAVLTLNRPEGFNSINPELFQDLSEALIRFRDDDDVLVGIITGTGRKAFCAGADVKTMIPQLSDTSYSQPPTIMRGMNIPKPLLAAVNGLALGGGMELAMACDIRIASENASFGQPEVKLGLIPGWGGTQRLPRLVPIAASELLLVGNTISAAEAYRIGLVSRVVPLDELLNTARELAMKICENGPLAVLATKDAITRGLTMNLEDGLALESSLFSDILATEDCKEGITAFAEKRKPQYKSK